PVGRWPRQPLREQRRKAAVDDGRPRKLGGARQGPDVVQADQTRPQRRSLPHLLVQRGSTEPAAGLTIALRVDRPWIALKLCSPQIQSAGRAEGGPSPTKSRRQHAVKHVDAETAVRQDLLRSSNPHQVARSIGW